MVHDSRLLAQEANNAGANAAAIYASTATFAVNDMSMGKAHHTWGYSEEQH